MLTKLKPIYADDTKDQVSHLVSQRLPWLAIGFLGAIASAVLISKFERQLAQNISLAFFIPAIVYLADAVGTQTEGILLEHHRRGVLRIHSLIAKELSLGLVLGIIFGAIAGTFASFIAGASVAITVGLAMFVNLTFAPLVAVSLVYLLQKHKTDPALGAGPFATVLQDIISLLVYFVIASLIVF